MENVTVAADKPFLNAGTTAALTVSGVMTGGMPADLDKARILYASDDEQVATVSADGTVHPVKEGTAHIQASVTLNGITRENGVTIVVDTTTPDAALYVGGKAIREGGTLMDDQPLTFEAWDDLSGLASAKITIDGTDYLYEAGSESGTDIEMAGKPGSYTATMLTEDEARNKWSGVLLLK